MNLRFLFLPLLYFWALLAVGQVTITGPIYIGPGNTGFNGKVEVCGPGFIVGGSTSYVSSCLTQTITNGSMSFVVYPTVPAGTSYRVRFISNYGQTWTENWIVPSTPSSQTRASVLGRAGVDYPVILPSQIARTGAVSGQCLKFDGLTVTWGTCGGMESFNGRSGAVTPQSGDYSSFYSALGHGHAVADVTNLQAILDAKAASSHGHNISDVTSLQGSLDSKAAASHSHAGSDVTSGTIPAARLGSGTPNSSTWLRGDGSWQGMTIGGIDSGSLTGTGTKIPVTSGVPADGCAKWLSGVLGSTAAECGTGSGGTTTSVASASQSFTSQTSVTITHNFGTKDQNIYCRTSGDAWLLPSGIAYGTAQTVVSFSTTQSGTCWAVGGTGLTGVDFTSQTSATITHAYNTKDVGVQCRDTGDNYFEPNGWTATSTSQIDITFTGSQSGRCVAVGSLALTGGGGGGGVSSVTVSGPVGTSATGNPITGSGTIAISWDSQTAGKVLAAPASSTGTPSFRVLAQSDLPTMTGDSGSGGVKGAVPAPSAGDAAAGKYLKADGTWAVPAGGGGGGSYTAGDGIQIADGVISVDSSVPATTLSGSQSLTFGTIAQSSCVYQTITATGVVASDVPIIGYPPTLADGLVPATPRVSTDAILVGLCKITTGSADVTGLTFRYLVIRGR